MPRLLGHYSRDQHLLSLEMAVRKITSLPPQRERLANRGILRPGNFADITIFDSATILDHATYTEPTQLSTGVDFSIVNGQIANDHGKLTGAASGQVLRGPGYHAAN